MSVCESAAVVGLGLIGGSVARDLAARGVRVHGHDANAERLKAAVDAGIVSCPLDESLSRLSGAEVIIIAVPVDSATDVLRRIAPHAGAARLITDVGSTKARIVHAATEIGLRSFVGSHPMAGDHRSGWEAARTGLFENARVYLCPGPAGAPEAAELAAALWRELGARPVTIAAGEHDRRLAWASHLPHIVSAALGVTLGRGGVARHDLGPGGRDVTRLAGSSPALWTAIARDNAESIAEALGAAERELAGFRAALLHEDDAELRRRLTEARGWFDE